MGKPDNPAFSGITKFPTIYRELRKKGRFKECVHPQKDACSEKIIQAHSLQNNRVLSRISDSGYVFMPCPKPDFSFRYGRKEASVFTGFCGFHDKTVFQPIEDMPFTGTSEQIFLYTYRAFALEYHRKQEAVRIEQFFFSQKPSIINMPGWAVDGVTGHGMAVNDFIDDKELFDSVILNKSYDELTSIVWEFPGFSNFAASGYEAPMLDFSGKKIQDLLDPKTPARHIYLCVFPDENKTYAIISWLKKYDSLFISIKEKLLSLTFEEKKNYINNTLPIITENIAIRPSSWDALSPKAQNEFLALFSGIANIMEVDNRKYNRFITPSFDLFSL